MKNNKKYMNYKKIGVFLIVLIIFNILFFNIFYNREVSENKTVNLAEDKKSSYEKIDVQEKISEVKKEPLEVSKKDITGEILNVNQEEGFGSEKIELLQGTSTTFCDNFNRADSQTIGSDWFEVIDNFEIYFNFLSLVSGFQDSTALVNRATFINLYNSAQTIICNDIYIGGTQDTCGLIARYVDQNNYYYVTWKRPGGVVSLDKKFGGIVTNIATVTDVWNSLGSKELGFVVNGNNLLVYFDGSNIISATDVDLQSSDSRIGVFGYATDSHGTRVNFDDYRAASYASSFPISSCCGNSIVETGEQCDQGANNGNNNACTLDCTWNLCGDGNLCSDIISCGILDGTILEQCDDGVNNGQLGFCNPSCTGIVQCLSDSDCNDNNLCNGVETCNLVTLTCVPGTPVDCSALSDQCNVGTCNPIDGSCSVDPLVFSYSDDFNRADGVLGSNWLSYFGLWDINNNKAHTMSGGSVAVWKDVPLTADYWVQGTLSGGGVLNWRSGIGGRILDNNNGYYLFGEEGLGLVQLRKEVGGGVTQLASWTGVTFPATVRLLIVGNSFTVTINGDQKAPIIDSSLSLAGSVGLWSEGGFNSEGFVDDWSAGGLLPCDDSISCTVNDQCNLAGGCVGVLDNSLCNNGLYCDGVETCDVALGCLVGTVVDCSVNNLDPIATCTYNPDNIATTWDSFQGFMSSCDENSDSCTTGSITLTHSCSIVQCGAQCEINLDCGNYCSGDVYFYNGLCQGDCSCSYTNENCNLGDDWFDSGVLRWISMDQCNEKEQKEQEYRDYTCGLTGCEYSITQMQWIDTGNTRTKTDGTLCNDGLFCNGVETCQIGVCTSGPIINCGDGVSCTTDLCDEGVDLNDNLGQCINNPNALLCGDGVSCTTDLCDVILGCQNPEIDNDLDTYSICSGVNFDCNDNDPLINPGASEICTDGFDNNCNNECDYDTSLPCILHGDVACPVGVTSISTSNNNPFENTNIEVRCNANVANVNSIQAYLDTTSCIFDRWENNDAIFICNVGSVGVKTLKCTIDLSKSYQSGDDKIMQINVMSSVCSDYNTEIECPSNICEWCSSCLGTKSSGIAQDTCVNLGACSYVCIANSCGAVCDQDIGCSSTDCDYLDGCVGRDYYDYSDVTNACLNDCSCENNICGAPAVTYEDPYCISLTTTTTLPQTTTTVFTTTTLPQTTTTLPRTQCSDGIDNDNGGLIDLQDPGCRNNPTRDTEIGQCQDGIDNDNDAFIDYPVDLGCENIEDDDEAFISATCNNNGIREGSEECDGIDFGSITCGTYGFNSGSLKCTQQCIMDSSGCYNSGGGGSGGGGGGGGRRIESGIKYACNDAEDNDNDGYCDLPDSTCIDGSMPGDPGCYSIFDDNETNFIPPPYLKPPEMCKVCWGKKDLSNMNIVSEFFDYQNYFNNIYQSNNIECCECNLNGIQDLGEEGIDCGGVCPKCGVTKVIWTKCQIAIWLIVITLLLLIMQFFMNKLNKLSSFLVGVYVLAYVSLESLVLNCNLLNILGGIIIIYQLYIISRKREISFL